MTRSRNIEELLAYAAGELDARASQIVQDRIAHDAGARAIVEQYRAVLHIVRMDDSVEPSARAIEMATAVFEDGRAAAARAARASAPRVPWLDRLNAVIAELLFDSRLQPLAVRRGHTSELVQLAYEADDLEIELRASWRESDDDRAAGEGSWRMMGQISGERDDLRADIALVHGRDDLPVAQTTCDEVGMFVIDAPRGVYDLCVQMPGTPSQRPIVLAGIELP